MKIMQGDSYPIYIELMQDGTYLTPEMVADLEVCVGTDRRNSKTLRNLYSKGEVYFEQDTQRWYIHPTQQETLSMPIGACEVIVRVKYNDDSKDTVIGVPVGWIHVGDNISKEVI